MSKAPALRLTEERTFTAQIGERTVAGLAVTSAWEGFTKYAAADGSHLIVLDVEQRIVTGTPALMSQLGICDPQIGDEFEGGIYAGLTEVDGKPARLILLSGVAKNVSWDSAMKWAELQGGDLPTRAEQRTLYEHLKSEFSPTWHWSSTQHADYPTYAWGQYFDDGGQVFIPKSLTSHARAVRRLPI